MLLQPNAQESVRTGIPLANFERVVQCSLLKQVKNILIDLGVFDDNSRLLSAYLL